MTLDEVDWSRAYSEEAAQKIVDEVECDWPADGCKEGTKKRLMMTPEERELLDCDRD